MPNSHSFGGEGGESNMSQLYNEISGKSGKLWGLSVVQGDISAAVVEHLPYLNISTFE